MSRGASFVSTIGLKEKLATIWEISMFKVAPIGRGYYYFRLHSMGNQSKILSIGAVNLNPVILRMAH